MTDLIERLRNLDSHDASDSLPSWTELGALGIEAAAEITALRAKIEAISQVAGKASIDGVTFTQIKDRIKHPDSHVLGKYTGPLLDSMAQTAEILHAKALNDGK